MYLIQSSNNVLSVKSTRWQTCPNYHFTCSGHAGSPPGGGGGIPNPYINFLALEFVSRYRDPETHTVDVVIFTRF